MSEQNRQQQALYTEDTIETGTKTQKMEYKKEATAITTIR